MRTKKKGNLPRAIFSFHYRNICKFLQELIIADKELAYPSTAQKTSKIPIKIDVF